MADILGYPEDPAHWNETVNFPNLEQTLENSWEMDTPGMFGATSGGIGFSNVAPAANSMFPRDWVVKMAEEWMDNSVIWSVINPSLPLISHPSQEKGFYGEIPLTRVALQDWVENENDNFSVVPGRKGEGGSDL